MNADTKNIVIIAVTILALAGAFLNQHDILLAVASGLIGYLSKDTITGSADNDNNTEI